MSFNPSRFMFSLAMLVLFGFLFLVGAGPLVFHIGCGIVAGVVAVAVLGECFLPFKR